MPNLAKTELRWGYSPQDLFSGQEAFAIPQGALTLDGGPLDQKKQDPGFLLFTCNCFRVF